MTDATPSRLRNHVRTPVYITVSVSGVLDMGRGTIVDLSPGGARIDGFSLPVRSRCEIHYRGETIYGTVMWAERDRMGVRFPYELTHGALFDTLESARGIAQVSMPGQMFLARNPAGFGRRGLS